MHLIQSFKNFESKSEDLHENVQQAKALLLNLAANAKRKRERIPQEEKIVFTPEEEKEILNNPDYIELRDYMLNKEKSPNLVYPFTYFMFEEKVPMTCGGGNDTECFSIMNLKRKLDIANSMKDTFPLPYQNIEMYIKEKIKSGDNYPAYEKLWDDIEKIIEKRPIKEFVDKFVGPIRREFTNSLKLQDQDPERKELLERIYSAVSDIKKLKPRINEETGKEETAEGSMIQYASMYKDTLTYPEFKDTYVAFKAFVKNLEDKISGWNLGFDEFIEELRSIAPSIKILYINYGTGLVVTSSRSYQGVVAVCNISNSTYCIRNQSTFWSYTSGKLQISFNLLKLKKTDDRYLTSLTIQPDGVISASGNRQNQTIHRSNENYIAFLKRYNLIDNNEELDKVSDILRNNFSSETTIKKIIESIEKKLTGSMNKRDVLSFLGAIGIRQAIANNNYTQNEMDTFKEIIIGIIKKDLELTYEDIVEFFSEDGNGGFILKEDIELFEIITEKNYKKEDVRKILEVTIDAIPSLQSMKDHVKRPDQIKIMDYMISQHPSIVEYVKNNML